jgi:hypothetical protein
VSYVCHRITILLEMSPRNIALFNLREIIKHMLVLIDNVDSNEFCKSCVDQRLLLMEARAEDAMAVQSKWNALSVRIAIIIRRWQMEFHENDVLVMKKRIYSQCQQLIGETNTFII